jgi:hypothetical protein
VGPLHFSTVEPTRNPPALFLKGRPKSEPRCTFPYEKSGLAVGRADIRRAMNSLPPVARPGARETVRTVTTKNRFPTTSDALRAALAAERAAPHRPCQCPQVGGALGGRACLRSTEGADAPSASPELGPRSASPTSRTHAVHSVVHRPIRVRLFRESRCQKPPSFNSGRGNPPSPPESIARFASSVDRGYWKSPFGAQYRQSMKKLRHP